MGMVAGTRGYTRVQSGSSRNTCADPDTHDDLILSKDPADAIGDAARHPDTPDKPAGMGDQMGQVQGEMRVEQAGRVCGGDGRV